MSYLLTAGRAGLGPLLTNPDGSPTESVWYSTFQDYSFYDERAQALRGRFATATRVLVAGCGFGYFVSHLITRGYTDSWGTDLSQYAIDQSKARLPSIAGKFVLGDCRSLAQMTSVRDTIWARNRPPEMIITEDLLTAQQTDQEVTACLSALRPQLGAGGILVHIVTCLTPENADPTMRSFDSFWKTFTEWQVFAPGDVWVQANSSPLLVMRNGQVL